MISTMSRPRMLPGAPPRALPLFIIIGAVAALAVVGGIVGFNVITTPDDSQHQHIGYGVGDDVPTSYGMLSVTDVTLLAGLSSQDLAGVTHGVGDLVPPDKEQVEISMVLTNTGDRAASYSFPDQFKVVTTTGAPVQQLPALSAPSGKISGHSSMTTELRFMAPRDGGDLILEYRESGARTTRVLVGTTDEAPAGALDGYHDHTSAGH